MSAFDEWFKEYYIKHGFISSESEARDTFNAGMTVAAEICESLTVNRPSDHAANYHDGGCRHCADEIRKARDGE